MAAQYSYIGLSGEVIVIADSNINFRGAWSGSTSYAVKDAAVYNGRWFITVTAHTGVTPPTTYTTETPTYWSPLVLIEGDPALADTNSEIVAGRADSVANQALTTSWAGTNTANNALALAMTGTDAANQAYSIAVAALNTAWVGTNAAGVAETDAHSAYSLARLALDTAWVGTNAAAPLSFAAPGTHVCFVSASRGGPNDVEVGILNGVVTSFVQT